MPMLRTNLIALLTLLGLSFTLQACANWRLQRQVETLPERVEFAPEPVMGDPETTIPDARSYSHFLLGLEALRNGDLATAREHLRIVVQRNPGAREAREHLFQVLLAESRVGEAMSLVTDSTMLARVPGNQLAHYGILMAYQGNRALLDNINAELSQRKSGAAHLLGVYSTMLAGDASASEAALKSLSEDPQWSAWGRLYLGRLYEAQGRLERARDVYAAALASESSAFTLLSLHLATVQAALHQDEDVQTTVGRMRRTAPGGVEAITLRVYSTMRRVAPADAARMVVRRPLTSTGSPSTTAFPGTATDIALVAYQFLELGDVQTATSLLLLASVLQPDLPLAQVILGLIATESEQLDQAMLRFERAMALENPYRDDAMNQYGQLLLEGRDITEATTGLAELLEEGSSFSWHATLTGRMAGSAYGDEGAIDLLSKLERKNPQPELRYQRAMRLELLGRRDQALELVREVLRTAPDHAEALNYLGYSLADQNRDLPEARAMIYRAATTKPWSGHILDSLAWVEYRMGQHAAALEWMQLALEYSPPDPVLHEHMGDILVALGKKDAAVKQYQAALALEPEPELAQSLRAKIEMLRRGKST